MFNLAFLSSLLTHRQAEHGHALKLLIAAGLAALTILATLFIGTGINNALAPEGSHDFQWTPSKDLVNGVNPYEQFISWHDQGKDSVPEHFLNHSPSYPASTYVLLSPFAHLSWEAAKLAWLCANLAFIALLLVGMQRVFPVSSPLILSLLVLSFLIASPLRTSLGAGQHNFISLAAFIWAYYFALNKNTKLAGFLLAIAWIKYSLTFPLTLIFLRRGNYKPVLLAAAIHAILTCIAAWKVGMWPNEFFFSSVQVVLMGDGTGFLNLIAMCMNLDLPLPVPLAIIAAATLLVTVAMLKYKEADDLLVMAFLGLFSCAVFYHHGYDFIVLLLCAWALALGKLPVTGAATTACLLAIAWVGQWFIQELSPQFGPYLTFGIDYLLVSVFYCTLFMFGRAIYSRQESLKLASVAF